MDIQELYDKINFILIAEQMLLVLLISVLIGPAMEVLPRT